MPQILYRDAKLFSNYQNKKHFTQKISKLNLTFAMGTYYNT